MVRVMVMICRHNICHANGSLPRHLATLKVKNKNVLCLKSKSKTDDVPKIIT